LRIRLSPCRDLIEGLCVKTHLRLPNCFPRQHAAASLKYDDLYWWLILCYPWQHASTSLKGNRPSVFVVIDGTVLLR